MPYIEQPQIATQKPVEQCPRCKAEMDAEFIDNGFGPYAVQASPWRCPECGYDEYWGMPESEAQAIFDSFLDGQTTSLAERRLNESGILF